MPAALSRRHRSRQLLSSTAADNRGSSAKLNLAFAANTTWAPLASNASARLRATRQLPWMISTTRPSRGLPEGDVECKSMRGTRTLPNKSYGLVRSGGAVSCELVYGSLSATSLHIVGQDRFTPTIEANWPSKMGVVGWRDRTAGRMGNATVAPATIDRPMRGGLKKGQAPCWVRVPP